MTLHIALQTRFDQTVVVHAHSGYNARGDATYSTSGSTHMARVEGHQHLVRGPDGRDVIARTTVFLGPTSTGGVPACTVQSKITLPDSTVPKILAVDTVRDRTSVNHQAVHCG